METFFTTCHNVQHIIKSFNLTKTLFVSSIIIGEAHTGKKYLAQYLFPDAYVVSGEKQEEVENALKNYDEIIITDFEKLTNKDKLDFDNKRILATANYMGNPSVIDEMFAFIYTMPSLVERPEDTIFLRNKFTQEATDTLMIPYNHDLEEEIPIDLSSNAKSLKKSIYYYLVKQTIDTEDMYQMLYNYLYEHFEGNDNYRKHLVLYEKPLIEAGLKKYGSQLQLSAVLGINRNTLRKKINEHKIG